MTPSLNVKKINSGIPEFHEGATALILVRFSSGVVQVSGGFDPVIRDAFAQETAQRNPVAVLAIAILVTMNKW